MDKAWLVPGYKGYEVPTADGAIFQIIQVAVDTGIAQAAIVETIDFVRTKSRPWVDSGLSAPATTPTRSRLLAARRYACMPPRHCLKKPVGPSTSLLPTPMLTPSPKRKSSPPKRKFIDRDCH